MSDVKFAPEELRVQLTNLVTDNDLDTVLATLWDICEDKLKLEVEDPDLIMYWNDCAGIMERALKAVVAARKAVCPP